MLATATTGLKNEALTAIARAAHRACGSRSCRRTNSTATGRDKGLSDGAPGPACGSTRARLDGLADAVTQIVALDDPIGESVRGSARPNGLKITQVRVPFGVVGVIYEARPNVTIDIAALALKSGNAAMLRGGSAALNTNRVLVELIQEALASVGLPTTAVQTIDEFGRDGATRTHAGPGLRRRARPARQR